MLDRLRLRLLAYRIGRAEDLYEQVLIAAEGLYAHAERVSHIYPATAHIAIADTDTGEMFPKFRTTISIAGMEMPHRPQDMTPAQSHLLLTHRAELRVLRGRVEDSQAKADAAAQARRRSEAAQARLRERQRARQRRAAQRRHTAAVLDLTRHD